jgi:large subunit ribosomal protein L25
MGEASLAIDIRESSGKGAARQLRRDGRIPGVLYGKQVASQSISLDPNELDDLIRTSHAGINTLIDLTGPGDVAGKTVLVKELQREPVRGVLLHVDFFEVDQTATIRVSVPIHLSGTAEGVTMGGLIDHSLRVVELDCLPLAIPDEVVIDVSGLDIGDSIHVSDLPLPEGVELHTAAELSVVSVVAPKVEEEPVVEEGLEGEVPVDGEAPAEGEAPAASADGEGESSDS